MIEATQQELKTQLDGKFGIREAETVLEAKYDTKTAEVLEASVFEQAMQIGNFEAQLVSDYRILTAFILLSKCCKPR